MPKGRPPKKKRNISGLKSQPALSAIPLPPIVESSGENNGYHNQPDEEPDGGEDDDRPPQDLKDMASSEQEMLETFIKSRGHQCIFLPKFHCELSKSH